MVCGDDQNFFRLYGNEFGRPWRPQDKKTCHSLVKHTIFHDEYSAGNKVFEFFKNLNFESVMSVFCS